MIVAVTDGILQPQDAPVWPMFVSVTGPWQTARPFWKPLLHLPDYTGDLRRPWRHASWAILYEVSRVNPQWPIAIMQCIGECMWSLEKSVILNTVSRIKLEIINCTLQVYLFTFWRVTFVGMERHMIYTVQHVLPFWYRNIFFIYPPMHHCAYHIVQLKYSVLQCLAFQVWSFYGTPLYPIWWLVAFWQAADSQRAAGADSKLCLMIYDAQHLAQAKPAYRSWLLIASRTLKNGQFKGSGSEVPVIKRQRVWPVLSSWPLGREGSSEVPRSPCIRAWDCMMAYKLMYANSICHRRHVSRMSEMPCIPTLYGKCIPTLYGR